jgi:hypothetical protein
VKFLSDDDVKLHLESIGFSEISEGIWVSSKDPGCFFVDESVYGFDMRDGWSSNNLAGLLQICLHEHLDLQLPFKLVPYGSEP